MAASDYFEKFIKDLDKRVEDNKKRKTISEQEKNYQDQRRLRVRRYQERWQNRIVYGGVPNGKK
jgi:hypothetical protein|tara:strand:- start:2429 stop:2620 length:192 start_codon:yes stop_codon:yes gene_type:complete